MNEYISIKAAQRKAAIVGLNGSNLVTDKAALIESLGENGAEIAAILCLMPDHKRPSSETFRLEVDEEMKLLFSRYDIKHHVLTGNVDSRVATAIEILKWS